MNGGFLARLRGTQRQTGLNPLSSQISHRISHRFGWNLGTVVAATDNHGIVWVGFRCDCGKLDGVVPTHGASGVRPRDEAFT